MMIQCRRGRNYCCKTSILCSFLSQCHLLDQLKISSDKKHSLPKTFPVEVRAASSPPVHINDKKEEFDQAVLEALARANQKAMKMGDHLFPYSKHYMIYQSGNMTDIKRAGYDLAEQFITKYPESFKIRWSDKMSLEKLTSIEEICREKKIVRAREIFSKLEHGDETCLENKKKDLDALLDLFAFYNASTENPELPTLYDNRKMVHQYEIGNGESRDLPYTRSLFKILEVENRNILLVIRDLLKPECCPNLEVETKLQLLQQSLSDENHDHASSILRYIYLPSLKPQPLGINTTTPTPPDEDKRNRVVDQRFARKVHENMDYAPPTSPVQYVSVMNEDTALCIRALEMVKLYDVVNAGSYDAVVQSAVKFYRPDLAWKYYLEMRDAGFYPNEDTTSDLIYSITHEMNAEDFIESGAKDKIKRILSDLAESPVTSLNDNIFLNLFYGVHIIPNITDDEEVEVTPEIKSAIDKYNYNIFNEMKSCLERGMFKLRFSTACKILEIINVQRVGDEPKSKSTIDLNNSMYDLYNESADCFIRDYENTESTGFLTLLLKYARVYHTVYDIDTFYTNHLPDLLATLKTYHANSTDMYFHMNELINMLLFDLGKMRGLPLASHAYTSIEDIRGVTIFDLYNDFCKDNLQNITIKLGFQFMKDFVKTMQCLDPYATDIDYMLGLYKYIIEESIRVTKESKKIIDVKGDGNEWNVEIFTFLQDFYDKFNLEYLMKFSMSPTNLRSTFKTQELMDRAQDMVLSEANILDIIKMTSDSISLLLNNGGIPTTVMMYILVSYTLRAGEHQAAWDLLEMYNDYGIPLESPVLLKYIDLTPEWDTQSEMYFSQLSEPLQSTVRDQVKMLEKKYKQGIIALSKLQRYHALFATGSQSSQQQNSSNFSERGLIRTISRSKMGSRA